MNGLCLKNTYCTVVLQCFVYDGLCSWLLRGSWCNLIRSIKMYYHKIMILFYYNKPKNCKLSDYNSITG